MATVSQTIPNYYGGLSEQPDELKIPGQVNKLINVLPDITHGLLKRPGGKLVGGVMGAYTTDSKWFHYYRDEDEQYIGQLELSSGSIKMWRCNTGAAVTVSYAPLAWATATKYNKGDEVSANSKIYKANETGTSTGSTAPSHSDGEVDIGDIKWEYVTTTAARETALKNYLKTYTDNTPNGSGTPTGSPPTAADIQTLTLNDFTYFTNRNKITAMKTGAVFPERNPEAYLELKKVAYASQYGVNIFDTLDTDEVYTAIRIDVTREVDSKNGCAVGGAMPPSGTLPGTTNYTTRCSGDHDGSDSLTGCTDTQIFKIDHEAAGVYQDSRNCNGKTDLKFTVTANGGTASHRKNLYFRITTQGQAVAKDGGTDDIYRARYTTTFDLLYGGEGWRAGDYVYVWMKNAKYKVTIKEHNISKIQGNLGVIRPAPTSFDTKTTTTSEGIMGGVRTAIENGDTANTPNPGHFKDTAGASVTQVGNGLYLTRTSGTFNVTTGAGTLFNVFSNTIKDITELPSQCKDGYIVRVANSVADEDDYFVQFKGVNGRDGPGTWEECAEPGRTISFDETTLPIQMRREESGTFTIHFNIWDDCLVGDDVTVSEPSFIGKGINKMLFFRNRMVMLSDENVIMSRPGDFFNYWPKTAVTFTATDPVDLSCSSEFPAVVYDGIQVNTGLLLFTKNQQFMLTTDSDVLSPNTAKINALATYNFNFNTNPISMGTTVAFLDNAGKYSRFFEITAVLREGQPEVLEQSKPVSKSFPNDIDLIANSRENSVIFFARQGANKIYAYRYFSGIERRLQQAWFQWEVSGKIQHIAMLDDALYVVVRNRGADALQKFNIKIDDDSNTLVDDQGTLTDDSDDVTYRVHLDNAAVVAHTALADPTGSPAYTSFALPPGFNKSNLGGTYTRSAGANDLVVTTTSANEYELGQVVHLDFTTGSGVDDDYTITAVGSTTAFTVIQYSKDSNGEFNLDSSGDKIPITTAISGNVTTNPLTGAIAIAAPNSTDKTFQGKYARVSTYTDSGTRVKLPGNWKTYESGGSTITPANNIVVGYLFDMEVGFPTLYKQERGVESGSYRADIHSTLVLHRVKFSFGPLGVYRVIVKKTGKNVYEEDFEALGFDAYEANTISFEADKKVTIPIYEKNINLDLTLKSTHASPATLYSLSWEGDYTDGYYKRV